MINIVINGAGGRMGQAVASACREAGDCRVVAGIAPRDGGFVAHWPEAPIVSGADAVAAEFDLVVDFSTPRACAAIAMHCARLGKPLVSGTTGVDDSQRSALEDAARKVAVVHAPNMSAGVTLLLDLVRRTAAALGEDADTEIFEAHHRHKKDAPSGTALRLGQAVAEAWGAEFHERAVFTRESEGRGRRPGEIGFASLRAGDIVGEHQVWFALAGERIELAHRATDRGIFARGALRAARWVMDRPAGLYDMRDVLGL